MDNLLVLILKKKKVVTKKESKLEGKLLYKAVKSNFENAKVSACNIYGSYRVKIEIPGGYKILKPDQVIYKGRFVSPFCTNYIFTNKVRHFLDEEEINGQNIKKRYEIFGVDFYPCLVVNVINKTSFKGIIQDWLYYNIIKRLKGTE